MTEIYNDIYAPITAEQMANIPEEMKAAARWICWGSEKIPASVAAAMNGNHYGINIENAANWGTFEQAAAAIGQPAYVKSEDEYFHIAGIGFVVGDGWFCSDLDGGPGHGRENVPDEAITDALNAMQTYAEKSVSGCGYHVFGKCDFSTTDAEHNEPHRGPDGEPVPKSYEVEFFTRRKFIAITGRKVPGSSASAKDCHAAAMDFYTRYILTDWKRDEAKRAAERAKVAASIPVNADAATEMFMKEYPEILAKSDSSNFKRGGPGVKLAPGEYSWIAAVKAMQEIGIPESAIMDWCRKGSNFKSEKDVIKVLSKSSKPGAASVAGIIEDAKAHGWKPKPENLTGKYKANHEAAEAWKAEKKREEEEYNAYREAHREEHAAALAAIGIDCAGDPYRYTWKLDFDGSIAEVTETETGEIVYTKPAAQEPAEPERLPTGETVNQANAAAATPTFPDWYVIREYNGRKVRRINEPLFAQIFQDEYKVNRINGVFYVNGEEKSDDYILMLIQKKIAPFFKENTGRLTKNLFLTLSNTVYTDQPKPDESKIFCKNGITINVRKDGSFDTAEEDIFTLTRIGTKYNPLAVCPTWEKYLKDLFFEEDIPTVQEYLGYCLIPCTRAQAGLYIKGSGGEGKSTIRDVVMVLFGNAAVQERVHNLGDKFVPANLENKLVMVDDDLDTEKLSDTSWLKKLTTARDRFQVERKMKTKYNAFLYSRILAIGNTFIGSKFDHSDGFYRRQLLVDVKRKTRDEKDDDRFMSDKCIAEIEGILNWALEGLSRLVKNNYHFTVSERMIRTLDNIKHDGDNTLTFIEDDTLIEITRDTRDKTTTADLLTLYAVWCADNGDTPIKRKTFQLRMSERFKDYKIRIATHEGRLQGFSGIRLTQDAEIRLAHINDKERERILRLP